MGDEPNAMKPASREQAVFAEALQCATAETRAAYLDEACGADTALRGRVDALLHAAENAGDFLEQHLERPKRAQPFSGYFFKSSR